MDKRWTDSDGVHLDLRGLEPPGPMVAILGEIDCGATGPVIAYMDREPIFLYPELEERGWTWDARFKQGTDAPGDAPVVVVFRRGSGA